MKTTLSKTILGAALIGTLLTGCASDDQAADQAKDSAPAQTPTDAAQPNNNQAATGDPATRNNKYKKAPDMIIDKAKTYTATLKTNKGDIKIALFDDQTPLTVNNFVFLAKDGFYNGVKFHRIIKEFMIQTGDPLGRGSGGPGYEFQDELPPVKPYTPGVVAMANRGPDTNGSQFFIGSGDQVKSLDKNPNYTVFGEVVEGMETVKAIAAVKTTAQGQETSKPTEDVIIQSITIEEK